MTTSPPPLDVTIAGGGVGAVEAVLALHALAGGRVRTRVIAPGDALDLRPLRTVAAFTGRVDAPVPLAPLLAERGGSLRRAAVRRVLPEEHEVQLSGGGRERYDALVVAIGARAVPAYGHGVLTFAADGSSGARLAAALDDLGRGFGGALAFVVPPGVAWTLPLYELALLAARRLGAAARVTFVTPEAAPLALFGPEAAAPVAAVLEDAGIELRTSAYADVRTRGEVALRPGRDVLRADLVVALPCLHGRALPGLPADPDGFLPVDDHGRVDGVPDVYAVGDATAFPVKQGGLACQLADVVAEHVAARAGADVQPSPFRPVLRGQLVTGPRTLRLRATPAGGEGAGSVAPRALWQPSRKVDGRHLSRYLGEEPRLRRARSALEVERPLPSPGRLAAEPRAFDPYVPA